MNRRHLHFALLGKGLLASAALLLLLIGEQGLDAKPKAQWRPQPTEQVLSVQPATQLQPVSHCTVGESELIIAYSTRNISALRGHSDAASKLPIASACARYLLATNDK